MIVTKLILEIPEELSKKLNLARFDVLNQLFGHDFVPLFGSELIAAGHWVPASVWVEIKKALEEFEDNKKKKGKVRKNNTIFIYIIYVII